MNTLRNCFLALAALMVTACADESFDRTSSADEGKEALVSLSLRAAPESYGTSTRAITEGDVNEGTATDYKVTDFWLLEYNENGVMIGSPRYFLMEEFEEAGSSLPIILPTDESTEYQCVLLANTHAQGFSTTLSTATTLSALKAVCQDVSSFADLYTGENDLLMNGIVKITSTTESLSCLLYRNVAKLTLQLTNQASSGIKITSVQVRSVPDCLFNADLLYKNIADDGSATSKSYPSPSISETGFIDFVAEDCEINAGDETKELMYYLPRNCRGVTDATLESQKNVDVPDYATYVEIMAEDENALPLRYRFYLGMNMTNDFNVESNYHYILPISFADKGDAELDNRVEDLGHVTLEEANSYLINPMSTEAQAVYAVPIFDRINSFWSSTDGLGSNAIGSSTEWVAEVIWQDQAERIFNFCSSEGAVTEGNTQYASKGNDFFYFKPIAGKTGNVLIGVRRSGESTYLWSWHLWITDYNPSYTSAWQEGIYSYSVDGGHVYRYAGNTTGTNAWDTEYVNKYIMDRNLGALSGENVSNTNTRGFHYQFGRKDPFPNTTLYGIDGEPQTTFTATSGDCIRRVSGSTYFYVSIQYPYIFYHPGSTDWLSSNSYTSNRWNNPSWNTSDTGKSFFDPCPPGWKIPYTSSYNFFSTTGEDGTTGVPNAISTFSQGWNFYMSAVGSGETTWFPTTGMRSNSSGQISETTSRGAYWMTTLNNTVAISFEFTSSNVYSSYGHSRSYGCSIRCIQE
ncbi:MAG: DUF4906 domain-containing protein [Bacteroides sp.]|nr:DUF4906 domain-containing protein [Bacteroides sp.]